MSEFAAEPLNTGAHVTWTPPDLGGVPLHGYRIVATQDGRTLTYEFGADRSEVILADLPNLTSYDPATVTVLRPGPTRDSMFGADFIEPHVAVGTQPVWADSSNASYAVVSGFNTPQGVHSTIPVADFGVATGVTAATVSFTVTPLINQDDQWFARVWPVNGFNNPDGFGMDLGQLASPPPGGDGIFKVSQGRQTFTVALPDQMLPYIETGVTFGAGSRYTGTPGPSRDFFQVSEVWLNLVRGG